MKLGKNHEKKSSGSISEDQPGEESRILAKLHVNRSPQQLGNTCVDRSKREAKALTNGCPLLCFGGDGGFRVAL